MNTLACLKTVRCAYLVDEKWQQPIKTCDFEVVDFNLKVLDHPISMIR